MKDKFGILEAQQLVSRKKVSVPTVLATLDILGIPNKLAEEVNNAVGLCRKAIKTATDEIATAKVRKEGETARINEAIDKLNRELEKVITEVSGVESAKNSTIKLNEGQIIALEKLVKKFG